jgi:hypothetical protein
VASLWWRGIVGGILCGAGPSERNISVQSSTGTASFFVLDWTVELTEVWVDSYHRW